MPFCTKCGKEVPPGATYCPSCGTPITVVAPPPPPPAPIAYPYSLKNEGIAAVLSFIWTGLGQIYVGRIGRGIAILICGTILWVVCWIIGIFLLFIPLVFPIIFWAWNIYDAYKLAKQYNEAVRSTGKPPW